MATGNHDESPAAAPTGGAGGNDAARLEPLVTVISSVPSPVLRIQGDLDLATTPRILEEIKPLVVDAKEVVLDCSQITFCDSSGVRCLMLIHEELPPGATLALVHTSRILKRLLEITGVGDRFAFR